MTRKDYVKLAAALASVRPVGVPNYPKFYRWDLVVAAIGDTLADDNPRFDRARFVEACGA